VIFDVGGTLVHDRSATVWTELKLAHLRAELGGDPPWLIG
jgi:hypothetical protein